MSIPSSGFHIWNPPGCGSSFSRCKRPFGVSYIIFTASGYHHLGYIPFYSPIKKKSTHIFLSGALHFQTNHDKATRSQNRMMQKSTGNSTQFDAKIPCIYPPVTEQWLRKLPIYRWVSHQNLHSESFPFSWGVFKWFSHGFPPFTGISQRPWHAGRRSCAPQATCWPRAPRALKSLASMSWWTRRQ